VLKLKKDVESFHFLLHPRPVVLVCSVDKDGRPNVMACSWITPISEEPPLIALSLWRRGYTHQLIEAVKEFTVNIPSADLVKAVWIAGTRSGRRTDKFAITGLKTQPSKKVSAPIIEQCIGHLECKLVDYVKAGECNVYIAEVVAAYADEELLVNNVWNERANVLLHAGGKYFTTPQACFEVK
jgi:flavin reductase (DIM6/NTAB) family NADH-FMN oxidoreductase RutF